MASNCAQKFLLDKRFHSILQIWLQILVIKITAMSDSGAPLTINTVKWKVLPAI